MSREKSDAITNSQPIFEAQLTEFLSNKIVPMGDVIIDIFKLTADLTTLRIAPDGIDCWNIYAAVKDRQKSDSLVLHLEASPNKRNGKVELNFYGGPLELIPAPGESNVFCREFASIIATAKRAGVWAAGKGDSLFYGISVWLRREITLPSERASWFLPLLAKLSALASERYQDVSQQSTFWSDEKPPEEDGEN